jgi:hypothetical protein
MDGWSALNRWIITTVRNEKAEFRSSSVWLGGGFQAEKVDLNSGSLAAHPNDKPHPRYERPLEKTLPSKPFFRANRSQILSLSCIEGVVSWFNITVAPARSSVVWRRQSAHDKDVSIDIRADSAERLVFAETVLVKAGLVHCGSRC